ncbi:MAG TPA: hypothetical protein VGO81_18560 [Solirubrobacteraceae bacterium]|jgi:hypothetical protein|nr:hypothetical protein [Solirubrobacteraceae bacterium]
MATRHGRRHRKRRRSKFDVAPTPVTPPTPVSPPAAADTSVSAPSNDDGGDDNGRHGGGND